MRFKDSIQRATLSHPLQACSFSFKSTANMNVCWSSGKRGGGQTEAQLSIRQVSFKYAFPCGPDHCLRDAVYQPIGLGLSQFLFNSFLSLVSLLLCFCPQSLTILKSCWVKSGASSPGLFSSSLLTMMNFLPYCLFKFSNLHDFPTSSPED